MKAEIIAVGNELITGDLINTNIPYLSQKLTEAGIEITWHTDVPDSPSQIQEIIKTAVSRSDIIITTGGLGPTGDDITVENIAKALGRKIVFDLVVKKRIEAHFKKRNLRCPKINFRQAYVPDGAKCLPNNLGTAPGLIIEINKSCHFYKTPDLSPRQTHEHSKKALDKNCFLIALPGPPKELKSLVEEEVLPFLKSEISARNFIVSRVIKVTGSSESKVAEKINDFLKLHGDVSVGSYPHTHELDLKITAKALSLKQAVRKIDRIHEIFKKRLGDIIFGADTDTIESAAGKLLAKKKKTLSVAESCTGGLLSSRITDCPGSSAYFIGGIIAYSYDEKICLLNVKKETLKKYGAVSSPVVKSMAKNMRRLSNTDYALAVTGIAGPGGATTTKPVGLVYIGLADKEKCHIEKFLFSGARDMIKLQATQAALDMLRKRLLKK